MRRAISLLAMALIIITAIFIGCGEQQVEFDSEYINDVAMTTSIDKLYRPQNVTYTFSTDTPRIYCTFKTINIDTATTITAEWVYLKGEADVENYLIDSWTQLIEGNENIAMFLDNRFPNGWPPGSYLVALYINDEPQGIVPFRVK